MKRVLGAFILAAAAVLAAPAAHAQQAVGWYGTGSLGLYQLRDDDFNSGATSGKLEYDSGYALSIAGGYAFGNGFRAELEGGYTSTSRDSITVNGTKFSASGDIDQWSIYGAAYYDFTTNINYFRPYLGGGIGWISWDEEGRTAGGVRLGSGTDDFFSWFAEGGLSFPINDRMDVVPAVRYIWYDKSDGGFDNNEAWLFRVGLRYRF